MKKYPIYEVKTLGSVGGSIFFWEVWRFENPFERANFGSEGSRFGFPKVREVLDSVVSGSFQV